MLSAMLRFLLSCVELMTCVQCPGVPRSSVSEMSQVVFSLIGLAGCIPSNKNIFRWLPSQSTEGALTSCAVSFCYGTGTPLPLSDHNDFPLSMSYESSCLPNWLRSEATPCSTCSSSDFFYLVETVAGRGRWLALSGVMQLGQAGTCSALSVVSTRRN